LSPTTLKYQFLQMWFALIESFHAFTSQSSLLAASIPRDYCDPQPSFLELYLARASSRPSLGSPLELPVGLVLIDPLVKLPLCFR